MKDTTSTDSWIAKLADCESAQSLFGQDVAVALALVELGCGSKFYKAIPIKTIAKKAGIRLDKSGDSSIVRHALRRLQDSNLIETIRGRGSSFSRYKLIDADAHCGKLLESAEKDANVAANEVAAAPAHPPAPAAPCSIDLRDWFAAMASEGDIAAFWHIASKTEESPDVWKARVRARYCFADSMLAARAAP